ncbi:amidase domain-containing protein [Brevibacillus ruminantium]|uniref:Amidase domain-containing protein n=1 Tax=Brevibacillus ruminantium TaxID=2950604 RepID=A0ABY4WJ69_9BACL|nr:amidase domain-containing protein [Brevibacillus ruminantium]USG64706.1 amidase domain-containing protein [Brevibacillus ruminantium]
MVDRYDYDSTESVSHLEWQQFLKDYFDDVHRFVVDQGYERIWPFWKEGREQKPQIWEQWQRWEEQLQQRGATTLAVRGWAKPLYWLEQKREVQVCVVWHLQYWYDLNGKKGMEEAKRLMRVVLARKEDGWTVESMEEQGGDGGAASPMQDEQPPQATAEAEKEGEEERLVYPTLIVHGAGGYDPERAIAYAERYWNTANPAYPHFTDNCTNYISQCLHAGGIPMLFSKEKGRGWWMRGNGTEANWSFSWSVAHSLYLLLKSGGPPLRAVQVSSVEELEPGDIICYDFNGDGRFQHNTIVVAKDEGQVPLVNANTTNSRMRYWEYRDSTAYTPDIRYAFFRIRGT